MSDTSNWKPSMWGRAKAAFNKATTGKQKAVEKTTQGSEMVKKSQPALNGPKPPGRAGPVLVRQQHHREVAAEDKTARAAQAQAEIRKIQKPVIQSEHLKEGARLREQFNKAAEKDRDKGR